MKVYNSSTSINKVGKYDNVINLEQLGSFRQEATRLLKNKKREYFREKINDVEMNAVRNS